MTKRLFFGIDLPESTRQKLGEFSQNLRNKIIAPATWVQPEMMHITLHFLGNVDDDKVSLLQRVGESAAEFSSVDMELKNIGFYPSESAPRVVWVGAEETGGSMIRSLHKKLDDELRELGIQTDQRLWSPHITIARLKTLVDSKHFMLEIPNDTFKVASFQLYESVLMNNGPQYTLIKEFKLAL